MSILPVIAKSLGENKKTDTVTIISVSAMTAGKIGSTGKEQIILRQPQIKVHIISK